MVADSERSHDERSKAVKWKAVPRWWPAALVILVSAFAAGHFARDLSLISRALAKLEQPAARYEADPNVADMERIDIATALHSVALSRYPIGQVWMLEEIEERIIFSSRHGHFGYIQGDNIFSLDLVAPLGIENLRAPRSTTNPDHIRVTDLLVLPNGPHDYLLYVAHLQFSRDCVRMTVSVTSIAASEQALHTDANWNSLFSSACLPQRASGIQHIGNESGGRLVQLSDTALALSTGDFEFFGANGEPSVSDDPGSEFGKIPSISLNNGSVEVLATGLRNPQGLLRTLSGDLWETEHGPRGGDEVNLILPNRNYGWPHVTYGMPYGDASGPSWPPQASGGTHEGFERPRYAFSPSIGISNLVEPSANEFPAWRKTLLVSSLAGSALYVLHLDGGTVVLAERIALPDMRVRDIIVLASGRIALATDTGDLVILENADNKREQATTLSGLLQLDEPPGFNTLPFYQTQAGERLFALHCAQCHSLDGPSGPGPSLGSIIGSRVGSVRNYRYTVALSGRTERWSEARLESFLQDVDGAYPGTDMPQPPAGIDHRSIVRFLAARQKAQPDRGHAPR